MTQTTLSVDDTKGIIQALQRRFTDIVGPETRDICYATQNRQTAVRELSKLVDVILVVGATNSSNSNRLREIGSRRGRPELSDRRRQRARSRMGQGRATSSASRPAPRRPEVLVDDVIEALRRLGPVEVSTLPGREENIEFRLPAELTDGLHRTVSRRVDVGQNVDNAKSRRKSDSMAIPFYRRCASAPTSSSRSSWGGSATRWC